MATLKQIRQRIRTAKNIRQITRAMKLGAAARLRRATDRVLEARPYSEKMQAFMASLASAGQLPSHPLMEKRPIKNVCLILVTSDRGLAGAYNSSLIRKAEVNISTALAYNLMGALFGGLMEYNSMYFGFAFLYLMAIGFYFLAWAFSWNTVPAWLRWPRPLRQDSAL